MDNLWILTEERPKTSVIKQIINLYAHDFGGTILETKNIKIVPEIDNGIFKFSYNVTGISLENIGKILILTVSGSSSFFDFLVFKQEDRPGTGSTDNLLMAIEETKTSDDESRNTGVYQRASKFVFIDAYTHDAKLYMLYNDELECREDKEPSDTSKFGTDMLLTLGVDIIGKDISRWFKPFTRLEELIEYKSKMRKPPAGNVPIEITPYSDRIEISGRLAKPADAGNIAHDPNIGALSIISKTIRYLGWNKRIVITKHAVSQSYVNRSTGNKFLYLCKILNVELQGISIPEQTLPSDYWHYETKSEKVASILLHILAENYNERGIYENHAGCERGYFKTLDNKLITLPKKDIHGVNLYIPDLVLHDPKAKTIILIEGKKLSTLQNGVEEIEDYDSIENEYIKPNYSDCSICRYLCIFGGFENTLPHDKVLFYLRNDGKIIVNANAPQCLKDIFKKVGIST